MLCVPSAGELHLLGPRQQAFSVVASASWNTLPTEVTLASSLFNVAEVPHDLVVSLGMRTPRN